MFGFGYSPVLLPFRLDTYERDLIYYVLLKRIAKRS